MKANWRRILFCVRQANQLAVWLCRKFELRTDMLQNQQLTATTWIRLVVRAIRSFGIPVYEKRFGELPKKTENLFTPSLENKVEIFGSDVENKTFSFYVPFRFPSAIKAQNKTVIHTKSIDRPPLLSGFWLTSASVSDMNQAADIRRESKIKLLTSICERRLKYKCVWLCE